MNFRKKIETGKFVVTTEVAPPRGTDTTILREELDLIPRSVDAVNLPDNQRSIMRMSPIGAVDLLHEKGCEVILHITCRDRNRLALQSDLLGAWSIGVKNILAMTGDHPLIGDTVGAKPVYDLDSTQLLQLIQNLNRGRDIMNRQLEGGTDFIAGAVVRPDPDDKMQLLKLEKKVSCGARFIQTQPVYKTEEFKKFLKKASHLKTHIIAGILPIFSLKTVKFIDEKLPGTTIPKEVKLRIKNSTDPANEGIEIAAEIIRELQSVAGGVHIMPITTHQYTEAILRRADLL